LQADSTFCLKQYLGYDKNSTSEAEIQTEWPLCFFKFSPPFQRLLLVMHLQFYFRIMQKKRAQFMNKELAYICAIRAGHEPSGKAIAHTVLYFRCFIGRVSPFQQAKFIIVL